MATPPRPMPLPAGAALRVGAVNYLNSKPLVYGLADRLPGGRVLFDLPSRLADSLAAGRLDVALVPVKEYLAGLARAGSARERYRLVSDACVASYGPVRSVRVFFRRPPAAVRTLALDEGSRTSAALARVLLARRVGVQPKTIPLPIGDSTDATDADAVLLIGDRAMLRPRERFVEAWDLAGEWRRWTGMPFVFAVWAARPGVETAAISAALSASRDAGVAESDRIAEREAPALGLPVGQSKDYLRHNLHFRLGQAERASVAWFRRECESLGLLPVRCVEGAGG